jgi:hypothetical protein
MKEQRWPGDYQTKEQEFSSARAEENLGIRINNADWRHDFIAYEQPEKLDDYQKVQLEMSACSMLDRVGMQPHAREFIEHELNYCRSERKYEEYEGGYIDHPDGIQFTGTP